ncbi:MAG: two-component system OmpR family copper resistance phosphate regulon response regulator [Planctomycetota bacterium]|nr:MAG: two-component system OmpR family copper resistance phosphate regulon response regulator [Planctomycetota bacterium]
MKLLVVEDEEKAAAALKQGLGESGFEVDHAADGEEGLRLAREHAYDGIVLDIMLPKRDGWSVLTELRKEGRGTPILVLTARDEVPDRVKGFELGADDYLVKPFSFAELVARLRSLVRRGVGTRPTKVQVADLEIDESVQKASRTGKTLDLTPREFALLSLLAKAPGQVFSRAQISERIWHVEYDGVSNVIDVHVRHLRSKVDDPFDRKLIRTVRGVGYALDA